MTELACQAQPCAGVADHDSGLCPAHRRALTLTTKLQDALADFLRGNSTLDSAIHASGTIAPVVGAGTQIAHALAQLFSTMFRSEITYDENPVAGVVMPRSPTPWRVLFTWRTATTPEISIEDVWMEDDDELDDEPEDVQ